MFRRVTLFPLIFSLVGLLAVPAMAQEEEAQVHTSPKGYSIKAPAGWQIVSGELEQQELDKLPRSIREHYDPKTTDVMFMDIASTKDNEFKDNVNTVVLDEPVPVTAELIDELKVILKDQYQSLFENFQMKTFEQTTFGQNQAIRIEATYSLLGYNLVLYQALMSGPTKALVVTCTMEQSRAEDRKKICDETFASVTFE